MLSASPLFEIAKVLNAKIIQPNFGDCENISENARICAVKIDSRSVKKGELFVALKGENLDGHNFVQSLTKGTFALVEKEQKSRALQFLVKNSKQAFIELAKFARKNFAGKIVAITGNSGKTTTKDMTKLILSQKYKTSATLGNLNNDLGLPLSFLNFKKNTEVGVLELGANHLGEIRSLVEIAKPNIVLITNVTGAHLGEFGSFENIAKAKSEILEKLTNENLAILPLEDKYFNFWKNTNKKTKILSFALQNPNADLSTECVIMDMFSSKFKIKLKNKIFDLNKISPTIELKTSGEHQIKNALAATCIALQLGLNWQEIQKGLTEFSPAKGRMQIVKGFKDSILIDDTYNANQGSVEAAIDFLRDKKVFKKILVLGDIKELGDFSEEIHKNLGKYAKDAGIDFLFTFGDLAKYASEEFASGAYHFFDKKKMALALKDLLNKDSLVLIKASRSMKFEEILQDLH